MFLNSGVGATSLLEQLELEYSLITVCFELILPDGVPSCYFDFFPLIGIHRIDQRSQTL